MNPGKVDKKSMRFLLLFYFVGWVKPFTAYPAKAAFWTAEVFPGLTMKNSCFKGRDTIEKRCWERFAYPNLQHRFQVTSWSAEPDKAIQGYYLKKTKTFFY